MPTVHDVDAIRVKLEENLGPVQGSDLGAHLRRDAVFVVAVGHSLVACGVAIATDDAASVAAWLASGALRRPTERERDAWPVDETRRWNAVVVQPFVLVQELIAN